jgi:hypothetical protein
MYCVIRKKNYIFSQEMTSMRRLLQLCKDDANLIDYLAPNGQLLNFGVAYSLALCKRSLWLYHLSQAGWGQNE